MKKWALIKDGNVRATYEAETKPTIAASKGTYYEQILTDAPEILPTQKRIESWDVVGEQYVQSWEVVDKTPLEMWHHPEYCKRIIAPVQLIFDPSGVGVTMKAWFDLNGMPIVKEGGSVILYCNEILPDHQAVVDGLQGVITVEDIPTI